MLADSDSYILLSMSVIGSANVKLMQQIIYVSSENKCLGMQGSYLLFYSTFTIY